MKTKQFIFASLLAALTVNSGFALAPPCTDTDKWCTILQNPAGNGNGGITLTTKDNSDDGGYTVTANASSTQTIKYKKLPIYTSISVTYNKNNKTVSLSTSCINSINAFFSGYNNYSTLLIDVPQYGAGKPIQVLNDSDEGAPALPGCP